MIRILVSLCFFYLNTNISAVFAQTEEPVNVLFILVDDLGYHDLSFTGSEFYETPSIDRLISEGMFFSQAYAASPICSPSRAAIMTGKTPARINLTDYIPGNRHYGPHKDQQLASHPFNLSLSASEETLAETLKRNGYRTFFAGKWHLGEEKTDYPDYHGFEINRGGNSTGHPAGGYFSPYANPELSDGPEGEYLTDRLTEETIKFISSAGKEPFFAFLSFYTVHLPLEAKKEKVAYYQDKSTQNSELDTEYDFDGKTYTKNHQNHPVYAAMVESLDENIGRLMKALADLGLEENTLVVFTSDNGGMATSNLAEQIPTSNAPLKKGKGYLYEGGIKVPLLFRLPGKIQVGSQSKHPVLGTDLYPTILDLANVEMNPQQHVDGVSLSSILAGGTSIGKNLFWFYPHYSGGLGGKPSAAIRSKNYKLIYFFEDNRSELFDLEQDPSEKYELSKQFPDLTKKLEEELELWMESMNVQKPYANPLYQPKN